MGGTFNLPGGEILRKTLREKALSSGFPRAVDAAKTERNTKNAAYTVPVRAKATALSAAKQAAPVAGGADLPWWSPAGIVQRVTGLGLGAKKTPEELAADPRTPAQTITELLGGAGGALKLGVVALVAVAVIVAVPRLFSVK